MASPLISDTGLFAAYRRIIERKATQEGEEGFTLIELLIVIVVLGILAAVVVFSLGGITGKSALAACQADGNTISTAMAAFSAQNPGTMVTQGDLTAASTAGFGGPYIQSWPSNVPHYAYAIVGGVLAIDTTPFGAVVAPATAPTAITPTPLPGVTPAAGAFLAYQGPASCNGVS